jgi:hypothetical protein
MVIAVDYGTVQCWCWWSVRAPRPINGASRALCHSPSTLLLFSNPRSPYSSSKPPLPCAPLRPLRRRVSVARVEIGERRLLSSLHLLPVRILASGRLPLSPCARDRCCATVLHFGGGAAAVVLGGYSGGESLRPCGLRVPLTADASLPGHGRIRGPTSGAAALA